MPYEEKKQQASAWFRKLRDDICTEFEKLEQELSGSEDEAGKFVRTNWKRENGGGGEMSLMRGKLFEKVGVNISTVFGQFSPLMQSQIPGASLDPNFYATGISIVAHMSSPHIPAIHMNTRYIVTSFDWFGGGIDLTPIFACREDTEMFHQALKDTCDKYDPNFYPTFKEGCDKYFYLDHRKEMRGVGGIFYDYLQGEWKSNFSFTKDIGNCFLDIYPKIVRKNMRLSWSDEEREIQLHKRGRYVEFNLLYDRGTKFGLMTDGNVDAILMSMPPKVKW